MLQDLLIGQYYPVESPVHRLDPRTKILATMALVMALFFVRVLPGYGAVALLTIAVIVAARLPVSLIARSLRPVLWLVLLTVGLHALTSGREGELLWHLGPLRVTDDGLALGLVMGVRLALLVVISSLLTLTTSPIELTDGIELLLKPLRRLGVPAHEVAMMMTIALRFIPTLVDEADRIIKAQTARGADFESGSPLERARNMVPILVPLFVGAFRRAEELAVAMEARCYRGGEGRSRYRSLRIGRRDGIAGALVAVTAVLTVWLGR